MSKRSSSLGKEGEKIALSFLIKKGYIVDQVNYRCPFGEIDIIANDQRVLAFIEVKTRMNEIFGTPNEAVDFRKQQKLNRIALHYISSHNSEKKQKMYRFDVVLIRWNQKTGWDVELLKNAFPGLQSNY